MSLHDEYARITPFELTFQSRDRAESLAEAVRAESEGRGVDPESPHAFVTLGAVGSFIRELEGPDSTDGAVHQFGALAFQGVHFVAADCPLYVVTTQVARHIVQDVPGDPVGPPTPAGYLQFPQHLFWLGGGDEVPESVDGVYWTATPSGYLHSLLVTGLRGDRPGVGVVMVPEAPLVDVGRWLDIDARGDGSDFTSDMPGAEIDGLYSVITSGEILKLLARFFAYVDPVPESLRFRAGRSPGEAAEGGEEGEPVDPVPSSLPFTWVTSRT